MDTRMALGGGGGGRYDTLECGETVRRPELVDDIRTGGGVGTPLTEAQARITASQRHPGIHRHPTPHTHCSTSQKAHGSPNP